MGIGMSKTVERRQLFSNRVSNEPIKRRSAVVAAELPIDLVKEREQSRCYGNDGGEDFSLDSDLL